MRFKKYCITLIILLFVFIVAHSQDRRAEISVDFRVNSTIIDPAYSNNAVRMQEIIDFADEINNAPSSDEGFDNINNLSRIQGTIF